jgi:hypothetical protein
MARFRGDVERDGEQRGPLVDGFPAGDFVAFRWRDDCEPSPVVLGGDKWQHEDGVATGAVAVGNEGPRREFAQRRLRADLHQRVGGRAPAVGTSDRQLLLVPQPQFAGRRVRVREPAHVGRVPCIGTEQRRTNGVLRQKRVLVVRPLPEVLAALGRGGRRSGRLSLGTSA